MANTPRAELLQFPVAPKVRFNSEGMVHLFYPFLVDAHGPGPAFLACDWRRVCPGMWSRNVRTVLLSCFTYVNNNVLCRKAIYLGLNYN